MTSNTASMELDARPVRDLRVTRIFDAPRELVFKMWTDSAHLAKWWGPKGFTNPVCEVDPKPGGAIYIVMRAAHGVDHPMNGVFQEVTPPERLVFTNNAIDDHGNRLLEGLTTVTFEDHGGKTKLTLETRAVGLVEGAAKMLAGMDAGWNQSLDRLDSLVSSRTALDGDREMVATRIFAATRELVFKMWTEPEHIAKWWGPNGFTNTIHEMDVRPGGAWRFIMHGPDGTDYPNEIIYDDVVPPERLVYTHTSPWFQMTVLFVDLGGKTRIDARMRFESGQIRDTVVEKFGAMEGLTQTLERLGEHLEAV